MAKKIQNKNSYKSPEKKNTRALNLNKKTPFWFYIIPVVIPIVFFILLELVLRLFSYGTEYVQWVNLTKDKYIFNPEYTRKYFHSTEGVPYPNGNYFDVVKADNAFRIFILGESSAAGYPFAPNGDFGRYLRKRLEVNYPDKKIEVVNLGITAVNSYTIRDIMPGVIEQKPDLILIYTGHNEYYGALGVGSTESLGSSRFLINTTLWLEKFKTTQLIRNILKSSAGLFSSEEDSKPSGTLMARMAKDQKIQFDSDAFRNGLDQFQGNMNDILQMAKDNGVRVIISTLTSNLKDQHPFISLKEDNNPKADDIFNQALQLINREPKKADQLFRYAKDLDALRFRAPERINQIIKELADKYKIPCVNADSVFAFNSPYGITGNNLMTDHLHPTLSGYQLLGRAFFDVMKRSNSLPEVTYKIPDDNAQDLLVKANFNFSALDSIIAKYRIVLLKNDWPFSSPRSVKELLVQLNPQNSIDTIALKVVEKSLDWEEAHRMAANIYLKSDNLDNYTNEMLVLINQFSFIHHYYNSADILLEKKSYDNAYKILSMKERNLPDAFSLKWLGIIELSKNNSGNAIRHLNQSILYDGNDEQVYFNLAGAYALEERFHEALEAVNKCLKINPDFFGAASLKQQVQSILSK